MGNKQGHELSPEEKQKLKEEKEREKKILKEEKERKKREKKEEKKRKKQKKKNKDGIVPELGEEDDDAESVGGSSAWSEKSVGSAPGSWYHSASEPSSKRSSIYLPASAGPGYYQHDCWYPGYEDSGSEKSKSPSRAPSLKDTLNIRASSLERYPLGVPKGEPIEPLHKAGSLDLSSAVAKSYLKEREKRHSEDDVAATIASRYDETLRSSRDNIERTTVEKLSLINKIVSERTSVTDRVSLDSSVYHSVEEGSVRGEKRKASLEERGALSTTEGGLGSDAKRQSLDYASDHTSITGSIYYSADEGGSIAGSVYYSAASGSEVEDHADENELLGKERPSAPGKPQAVDREGSALSRLAYIKVANDALLLRWDAPHTDGGSPITGYILERSEGLGEMWVRVNLVPIKETEFAVANLVGGREYRFRVSAENAVGISEPSLSSEVVSISTDQEATEPHFLKELRDAIAVENQRVEFSVDIIGTPPPDITWYNNGFEVYDTRRFEFKVEGDRYTLVLKEAKLTDEGDIRVRATNRVGVASSQAALTVQAPPHIKLPAQYEQGLIFDTDELIRLRVPYTGRPQPHASWTHNGKQVEGDERHAVDVSEKYATLKIAGAYRMDKGMYTIKLSNPQGEDTASFFVTVTDRPGPPSVPTITDLSGTSVTLRWDSPQDDGGCRISNYLVEYFRVGWDVWLKAASSRITWTQLSDLIVGSEYRFRIKAENAYGVSEPGEESDQILIEDAKSPTGSFEYETYKSTTSVGSSLPKDSTTLVKGDSSSFEYGDSGESSTVASFDGGELSVNKLRRIGQVSSEEVDSSLTSSSGAQEPSLDLGSSSEKPPSFDYESSRGPSFDVVSSVERGPSFEVGSSVDRGPSFEVGSSVERGSSYEVRSSMERGPSYDVEYSRSKYGSLQTSSSAEHESEPLDKEISVEITGSDGRPMSYLPVGGSYELASSMDRGDSYEERNLAVSDYIRSGGSAGESMDLGGSLDGEEPPMPPPRIPRREGRSPAIPSPASPEGMAEAQDTVPTPPPRSRRPGSRTSIGSESSALGWSPTPARRRKRQRTEAAPDAMELEEDAEDFPTAPPRSSSRRSASQASTVTSETQWGVEATSRATPPASDVADIDNAQAAPDSTPSPATSGASVCPRMEAVTVVAGGEAVLVVSLENVQAAKISWLKGGREVVCGPHYTKTETQQAAQLVIHDATSQDSGTYTALVTRHDGTQARAAVALQVVSHTAPSRVEAPTFARTLSDLAAKVGTRVRFLVELRQAHDVKVYWYHNNVEVSEDPRYRLLHEGNFFCVDISPLSVTDEGPWKCVAENSSGQASSSASLRVIVPKGYKQPVFLEELEALLTAEGTVSLECKVVGVPTPILKWYKDGIEIKAGDVFALTANANDPTSLGTYTCEAVNCMGRTISSSRVRVLSRESSLRPPSRKGRRSPTPVGPPPVLLDHLTDRKVKVGDKARLSIKVETPPEVLSVSWYNDGRKVEESDRYRLSDEGGGRYMLEIFHTELGDDGDWKVVVKNEGGYTTSSCKLILTVPRNYREPRFLDNLRALLTDEGLVSFECKVVGYPTPLLQWFKDGQELKPGDVYQLSGTNSLGKYSCIAKNCMGKAQSTAELTLEDIKSHLNEDEKEQLLATNIPPRFIQGLRSRDVKIGDPIRFTVQVTVTPAPTVTWYHEDEIIAECPKYHMCKDDPGIFHLDVACLQITDQGEWKCVASNDYGHSVTAASVKLVIPRHYKKPVFLEPLRAVLSQEGTVNLECKVIGVPQPVLKWYKDGVELQPGDIHRIISGEDGTCCLGTYTCEAFNIMGSSSSSAALLGFEDKLLQKGGDKMAEAVGLADARGIARNPSLSTINEERSSQISVYESAVSEASEEERADVSLSIDGREVSLSLYETPDISEAEAKQIAEIYADEISDHLSAHESNQAELPPLRFTRETSCKGPLIMEAMVIDVENEAFDEYMSMADIVYDDARTEADVEELSAMEAVVVEEREALRSDIADLPEMEMWEEEHLSAHTVSVDGKAVAHISEQDVLQHDLRSLSEQGLSLLREYGEEKHVLGRGEAIGIEEAHVISAGPKSLITDTARPTLAKAQVSGLKVAQAEEQAVLTGIEKMKSETVERKQAKRSIEAREVAVAEEQQFLSEGGTLSDITNISKVVERYPSFVTQEAVAVTSPEAMEQAKSMNSEERPSKKAKKASVKKTQAEGAAVIIQSPEIYEGEATLLSEQEIKSVKAKAIIPERKSFEVASEEVMEDVATLETEAASLQHARVKDATQHEAVMIEEAEVSGQVPKSLKEKHAKAQKAKAGIVSAAGVAQQQEQEYYTASQDIPQYFQAEETEADVSELHSMLEPVQQAEQYGFEHAEAYMGYTPEQQMAMQLDPSLREALAVSVREGFAQAVDLTLLSGQETQAYAHQALHEAVEGYEQVGMSGDIRDMTDYMRAMSDRAQVLTDTTREALVVHEADVDIANLNVFNKEDMSHMLTVAEERSGSLVECIVVQEADLQSEAAIVSQRPAAQPERAVAGIVEGAAESATVGEPPVIAEMDIGGVQKTVETRDKKRSAAESAFEDEKVMASSKGHSVISQVDEAVAKKAKMEQEPTDGTKAKDAKDVTGAVAAGLTPEQIQARKEELQAKMEILRSRKEGKISRTPSSESLTSESLETEEPKIVKVVEKSNEKSKKAAVDKADIAADVTEETNAEGAKVMQKKRKASDEQVQKEAEILEEILTEETFDYKVKKVKPAKVITKDSVMAPEDKSALQEQEVEQEKKVPSQKRGTSQDKIVTYEVSVEEHDEETESPKKKLRAVGTPGEEGVSSKDLPQETTEKDDEKTDSKKLLRAIGTLEETTEEDEKTKYKKKLRAVGTPGEEVVSLKDLPQEVTTEEDEKTESKKKLRAIGTLEETTEEDDEKTKAKKKLRAVGTPGEEAVSLKDVPQEKTKEEESGTAQEKSVSQQKEFSGEEPLEEKEEISESKTVSRKKSSVVGNLKSTIAAKVSELKSSVVTAIGLKAAKVEEIAEHKESTEDLKLTAPSKKVGVVVGKDTGDNETEAGASLETSEEPVLSNQEKIGQEQAADEASLQKDQIELDDKKQEASSVKDSLAAKKQEILAKKQELLAKQEAIMKNRETSEEPSSELTTTSEISTDSSSALETYVEAMKPGKDVIEGKVPSADGEPVGPEQAESLLSSDATVSLKKGKVYDKGEATAHLSLDLNGKKETKLIGLEASLKETELQFQKTSKMMEAALGESSMSESEGEVTVDEEHKVQALEGKVKMQDATEEVKVVDNKSQKISDVAAKKRTAVTEDSKVSARQATVETKVANEVEYQEEPDSTATVSQSEDKTQAFEESAVSADASVSLKKGQTYDRDEVSVNLSLELETKAGEARPAAKDERKIKPEPASKDDVKSAEAVSKDDEVKSTKAVTKDDKKAKSSEAVAKDDKREKSPEVVSKDDRGISPEVVSIDKAKHPEAISKDDKKPKSPEAISVDKKIKPETAFDDKDTKAKINSSMDDTNKDGGTQALDKVQEYEESSVSTDATLSLKKGQTFGRNEASVDLSLELEARVREDRLSREAVTEGDEPKSDKVVLKDDKKAAVMDDKKVKSYEAAVTDEKKAKSPEAAVMDDKAKSPEAGVMEDKEAKSPEAAVGDKKAMSPEAAVMDDKKAKSPETAVMEDKKAKSPETAVMEDKAKSPEAAVMDDKKATSPETAVMEDKKAKSPEAAVMEDKKAKSQKRLSLYDINEVSGAQPEDTAQTSEECAVSADATVSLKKGQTYDRDEASVDLSLNLETKAGEARPASKDDKAKSPEAVSRDEKKAVTIDEKRAKVEAVTVDEKKAKAEAVPVDEKAKAVTVDEKKAEAVTVDEKKAETVTIDEKKVKAEVVPVDEKKAKAEAVPVDEKKAKVEALTVEKKAEAVTIYEKKAKAEAVPVDEKKAEAVTVDEKNAKAEAVPVDEKKAKAETVTVDEKKAIAVPVDEKKAKAEAVPVEKKAKAEAVPVDKKAKAETVTVDEKKAEAVTVDEKKAKAEAVPVDEKKAKAEAVPVDEKKAKTEAVSICEKKAKAVSIDDKAEAVTFDKAEAVTVDEKKAEAVTVDEKKAKAEAVTVDEKAKAEAVTVDEKKAKAEAVPVDEKKAKAEAVTIDEKAKAVPVDEKKAKVEAVSKDKKAKSPEAVSKDEAKSPEAISKDDKAKSPEAVSKDDEKAKYPEAISKDDKAKSPEAVSKDKKAKSPEAISKDKKAKSPEAVSKDEAKSPEAVSKDEAKSPEAVSKDEAKSPEAVSKDEAKSPEAVSKDEAKSPEAVSKDDKAKTEIVSMDDKKAKAPKAASKKAIKEAQEEAMLKPEEQKAKISEAKESKRASMKEGEAASLAVAEEAVVSELQEDDREAASLEIKERKEASIKADDISAREDLEADRFKEKEPKAKEIETKEGEKPSVKDSGIPVSEEVKAPLKEEDKKAKFLEDRGQEKKTQDKSEPKDTKFEVKEADKPKSTKEAEDKDDRDKVMDDGKAKFAKVDEDNDKLKEQEAKFVKEEKSKLKEHKAEATKDVKSVKKEEKAEVKEEKADSVKEAERKPELKEGKAEVKEGKTKTETEDESKVKEEKAEAKEAEKAKPTKEEDKAKVKEEKAEYRDTDTAKVGKEAEEKSKVKEGKVKVKEEKDKSIKEEEKSELKEKKIEDNKLKGEKIAAKEEIAKSAKEEEKAKPVKEEEAKSVKEEEKAKSVKEEEKAKSVKEEEKAKSVKEEEKAKSVKEEEKAKSVKEEEKAKSVKEEEKAKSVKEEEKAKSVKEEEKAKSVKEEENAQSVKEEEKAKSVKEEEKAKSVKEEEKAKSVKEEEKAKSVKEEEKAKSVKEEEKAKSVKEEEKAKSVKEEEKAKSVKEEEKAKSVKEEEKAKSVKEEEKAKSVKEEEKAKSVKEEKAKSVKEEEKAKSVKEEEKAKSVKEEEKAKSAKEEEKAKSAKEEEKAKSAKEDEKAKSAKEEEKAKSAKEEEKAKSAKEEEKAKSDKEEEKAKSAKEEEKAKSAKEEEKAKSAKEEEKAKSAKEEEKVKSAKEEEKAKSAKEEEKAKIEEKAKSVKEEEKAKSAKEEEKAKSVKEEEKAKSAKEEEKAKIEEKAKSAKEEEKVKSVKEEEKARYAKEEEKAKIEEKAKSVKEEEKAKSAKEEEKAKFVKEEEKAKSAKEEEKAKIEEKAKSVKEEEKAKSAKEEEKAKAAKEEEKVKSAKEEEKAKVGEKVKSAKEEEKVKSAKVEEKAKSAKEEEKAKSAKEEEKAKSVKEEEKAKSAKEEEKAKSAKEEEKSKSAKEEEKAKSAKVEEKVKSAKVEEKAKSAKEEEKAKSAKEEEKAKSVKEEEKAKSAKEEEKAKSAKEEEKAKSAKEEEKAKSAKVEEKVKSAKEEEKAKSVKEEEKAKSVKEEEKAKSIKEEEKAKSAKEEEKVKSAKEKEKAKSVKEEEKAKSVKEEEKAKSVKEEEKAKSAREEEKSTLKKDKAEAKEVEKAGEGRKPSIDDTKALEEAKEKSKSEEGKALVKETEKRKSPEPKGRKRSVPKDKADAKVGKEASEESKLEKERKKSRSPGERVRKRSSVEGDEKEVEATESSRGKQDVTPEVRKRSSIKDEANRVAEVEPSAARRSSAKDEQQDKVVSYRAVTSEAVTYKPVPSEAVSEAVPSEVVPPKGSLDKSSKDTTAVRAAELRQQEEILRKETKRREQMRREEEQLLRQQEEERARREKLKHKEEMERLEREEKEMAEKRKKKIEEENKQRMEELEKQKKQEEERAEKRRKHREEQEKLMKEEEERQQKEEKERKLRLKKRKEEQEKLQKEEDERMLKEEEERREKRRQRRLEEEKAMRELEEKY
ncbi:hypothetical protein OTU49_016903, partial [Cherax quadricarinatus]